MDLQSFLTDVRVLVSTVLLAFGGCLAMGCSSTMTARDYIALAEAGRAKITIQTPTQGSLVIKVLGSEFSLSAGSQGTITVSADYSTVPSSRIGPAVGCRFPSGECNNMTADNCIQLGGIVLPGLCGQ